MSRLPDYCIESVVFIYPSSEAADNRQPEGGTGFIVTVQSAIRTDFWYDYVVTNSHVISPSEAPVVSVTRNDGTPESFLTGRDDWIHHPDGDDVAIFFKPPFQQHHRYRAADTHLICTEEMIAKFDIGPGDSVFMVGRFQLHDGHLSNRPSARFGRISQMHATRSEEFIEQGLRAHRQQSILVEMLSLSGFSGSPVFVELNPPLIGPPYPRSFAKPPLRLLGIACGHIPSQATISDDTGQRRHLGLRVNIHSGVSYVVPGWKLLELLDGELGQQSRLEVEDSLQIAMDELGPTASRGDVVRRGEEIWTEAQARTRDA